MLRLTILWTLCLFLAPLLVLQGLLVRARTVVLPAARGPSRGRVGEGASSQLLLGIGDSVIEGVGVAHVDEALTRQFAVKLQAQDDRPILWQTQGRNGDRVRDLIARLPLLDDVEPDLVLVSIGGNDVSHLTSVTRWQWEVTHLIAELKLRFSAPIVFLGIPPMGQFSALPQPLRFALGVRARLLDQTLQQAAKLLAGIYWFDTASDFQAQQLAPDGYHPGPIACESLAAALSLQFGQLLNSPVKGSTQEVPPVNWGAK